MSINGVQTLLENLSFVRSQLHLLHPLLLQRVSSSRLLNGLSIGIRRTLAKPASVPSSRSFGSCRPSVAECVPVTHIQAPCGEWPAPAKRQSVADPGNAHGVWRDSSLATIPRRWDSVAVVKRDHDSDAQLERFSCCSWRHASSYARGDRARPGRWLACGLPVVRIARRRGARRRGARRCSSWSVDAVEHTDAVVFCGQTPRRRGHCPALGAGPRGSRRSGLRIYPRVRWARQGYRNAPPSTDTYGWVPAGLALGRVRGGKEISPAV